MKFYCPVCAEKLSSDSFNEREAQQSFGHRLCTAPDDPNTLKAIGDGT